MHKNWKTGIIITAHIYRKRKLRKPVVLDVTNFNCGLTAAWPSSCSKSSYNPLLSFLITRNCWDSHPLLPYFRFLSTADGDRALTKDLLSVRRLLEDTGRKTSGVRAAFAVDVRLFEILNELFGGGDLRLLPAFYNESTTKTMSHTKQL